jgi:HEAT repeat protein
MGPAARAAAPALVDALKDTHEEAGRKAFSALVAMGAGAVPALAQALEDTDPKIRKRAIEALKEIGPAAKATAPALVNALRDTYDRARWEAFSALVAMGAGAVPALARALEDTDPNVRNKAADALFEIGPEAKAAVPALARALADTDRPERWRVASALRGIGPAATEAVPALIRALDDTDSGVFTSAAWALREIGPVDDRYEDLLIETLRKALRSRDRRVRESAAMTLGKIGPKAKEALPELMRLAKRHGTRAYGPIKSAPGSIDPAAGARVMNAFKPRRWDIGADAVWNFENGDEVRGMSYRVAFDSLKHPIRFLDADVEVLEDGSVPRFRGGIFVPTVWLLEDALFIYTDIAVGRHLRLGQDRAWSASLGLRGGEDDDIHAMQLGYKKVDYADADTFRGLRFASSVLRFEWSLLGGKRLGWGLVAGGEADICIGGSDGFALQSDMEAYGELGYTRPTEHTSLRVAARAGVRAAWDSGNDTFESDPYVSAGLSLGF